MSENLTLTFGDGNEFECTPDNTTLFTFLGKTALGGISIDSGRFNHVFFQTGEEDEETMTGTYMFRTDRNEETFDTVVSHIAEFDYPMVLNRREVPECDIRAYNNMIKNRAKAELEDLDDFFPESWGW